MKILITGASGFIGRNMLLSVPTEWEITALFWSDANFIPFLHHYDLRNVEAVRVNLADMRSIESAGLRDRSFDACLYLAALVDLPASEREPIRDLQHNLLALLNLLEIIICDRFIYLSSGAVYEGNSDLVGPQTSLQPILPYAIHKMAAESYVRFYAQRRKNLREYIILRFMGAYGPYEPPHKLYTKMLRSFVLGSEETFSLRGDGNNWIDAMYIDDAVLGLLAVLTGSMSNVTLDFGVGRPFTVYELVQETARIFDRRVRLRCEGPTSEYINFKISPVRMAEWFGFRPHVSYSDGIRMFAEKLPTLSFETTRSSGTDLAIYMGGDSAKNI